MLFFFVKCCLGFVVYLLYCVLLVGVEFVVVFFGYVCGEVVLQVLVVGDVVQVVIEVGFQFGYVGYVEGGGFGDFWVFYGDIKDVGEELYYLVVYYYFVVYLQCVGWCVVLVYCFEQVVGLVVD